MCKVIIGKRRTSSAWISFQTNLASSKFRRCQPRCLCVSIILLSVLLLGASAAIPAILLTKTTSSTGNESISTSLPSTCIFVGYLLRGSSTRKVLFRLSLISWMSNTTTFLTVGMPCLYSIFVSARPPSTAVLRWNSTGITIAGGPGALNGSSLIGPYGLAFDSSGDLYVADYGHNRILKITGGTVVTIAGRADTVAGNAANELHSPVHMLFDSNDNLYITDRGNNRTQLWSNGAASGTTVAGMKRVEERRDEGRWRSLKKRQIACMMQVARTICFPLTDRFPSILSHLSIGMGGTLNLSLYGPSTIRQGSDSGTLFISETFYHRIISYPSGRVIAGGNGAGAGSTQLSYPFGLVYDSLSNSLVISNSGFGTIVRWTLGDNQWTLMIGNASAPGGHGNSSELLNQPVGITMDPMGNLYVADSINHRIQFFLAGQSTGTTIAGITGVSGLALNQLNTPYWVILDSQLNMYVSDTYNSRVQKFLRYWSYAVPNPRNVAPLLLLTRIKKTGEKELSVYKSLSS